jgi:hypothetical protein
VYRYCTENVTVYVTYLDHPTKAHRYEAFHFTFAVTANWRRETNEIGRNGCLLLRPQEHLYPDSRFCAQVDWIWTLADLSLLISKHSMPGPRISSGECRVMWHPREGLFSREPLAR